MRRQLYALAPLVFKQYWTPKCSAMPNVLTIPLGVKSGETHSPAKRVLKKRAYFWCFASSHVTPLRTQLVRALASEPIFSPSAVTYPGIAANYTSILCNSLLALSPSGNSPDTWRAMEALDCGALPVMDDVGHNYYQHWLPRGVTSLFVVLNTSSEKALANSIHRVRILTQRGLLEERRSSLVRAYASWQKRLRGSVRHRLAALVSSS